jgi:hypothetical protein
LGPTKLGAWERFLELQAQALLAGNSLRHYVENSPNLYNSGSDLYRLVDEYYKAVDALSKARKDLPPE